MEYRKAGFLTRHLRLKHEGYGEPNVTVEDSANSTRRTTREQGLASGAHVVSTSCQFEGHVQGETSEPQYTRAVCQVCPTSTDEAQKRCVKSLTPCVLGPKEVGPPN